MQKKRLQHSQLHSQKPDPLLYVHIPFCDSKCNYCAFNSYTNINHLKKDYFNALKTQFLKEVQQNTQFETMFIGGGTPSTMNVEFYEKLFTLLSKHLKNAREVTIECNPNTSYGWLREIRMMGVNRISFGVQSFNEKKLRFLNRNHSPKLAVESVENAKKAGFENINIDLIYSTSMDTEELLSNDLQTAFSLPVTHISAYSLTIEENTKWEGDYSKRKNDEDLEIWFINKIKQKFPQYEISNFGNPCAHNLGYWEGKEYFGLGAGAVGFKNRNKTFRYYTLNDVNEYIKNPLKYRYEYLNNEDIKKEKVFLGLRCILGFEKEILNPDELQRAQNLIEEKKLYIKNGRIHAYDFLLADAMSAYILD